MRLDRDRPEILQPPEDPQACCTQLTITVPPEVNAKTAQKHDYPSAAWRRSYSRRSGAERGFATAKDPASNDISRGLCRLMGLAPLMLFTVTLLIVRNQRILIAWDARQEENARRAARGLPPRTRRRRRKTAIAATAGPPWPRDNTRHTTTSKTAGGSTPQPTTRHRKQQREHTTRAARRQPQVHR
jgi:hypothetical protein